MRVDSTITCVHIFSTKQRTIFQLKMICLVWKGNHEKENIDIHINIAKNISDISKLKDRKNRIVSFDSQKNKFRNIS